MECAEVYMLHELATLENPWRKCVRVSGYVEWQDIQRRQCIVTHRGHHLRVDCSLVDLSVLKVDSLCQIIGELRQFVSKIQQPGEITGMYLLASVVRNVDGLDLDLFEQSLKARRSFLEGQR